ncbi:hypothetical protein HDU85_001173 [Gaertneriomyces sp. JEL0708]|nr:hypothetical protein HDU85_001173 [Gaertneriomyces sp. JEL0708]
MGAAVAPAPAEVGETIALDIALQLQDIAELRASLKGKGKDPSDEEIALEAYENELRAMLSNTGDIQLAWSIARAVQTDASVLAVARAEEKRASVDRRIALALANGGTLADAVADAKRGTGSGKEKERLHDFQWSDTDSESDASKTDGSVHSGSLRLEDLEASSDSDEEKNQPTERRALIPTAKIVSAASFSTLLQTGLSGLPVAVARTSPMIRPLVFYPYQSSLFSRIKYSSSVLRTHCTALDLDVESSFIPADSTTRQIL